MIYPTRAAVLLTAIGVPIALATAFFVPARWYVALAWPLALVVLTLLDALLGMARARLSLDLPATIDVGGTGAASVTLRIAGGYRPPVAEIALGANALLSFPADHVARVALPRGETLASIAFTAIRRGRGRIEQLWARWTGPIGLCWHQARTTPAASVAILPDLAPTRTLGARIFERHALQGLIAQVDRGDGSDFDTLVEFRSGMDRRAIDWKHSARHLKLHAKEYRSERNNQILFLIDGGRQMREPVAGLPRVDRAVAAMLLAAWVALKLGDRVALQAFDDQMRVASGFVSGVPAFPALQRLAADIDYSDSESNYTLALTALAKKLTRRSMIVLFTEFTDPVAADFLVRAAARLVEAHLLLVVVLADEELEAIAAAPPEAADDVSRAITAAALLRERRLVLTRLRHLGAHIVEAAHDAVNERLVEAYVDLKRRNVL